VRQAQIFVAVMGASSYTYAEATWTQTLPDWIPESNLKGDVQQQIKEVAPPRNQISLTKSNS